MLALRGARLFDGRDAVSEPVVVIDGAHIVAVGVSPPADAEVVDLGDVTLLPGLIDPHQHLCFSGVGTLEEQIVNFTDDELRARARANALTALRAGITTVRDLGDRDFVTLDLRDDPELPTILSAGPPLTVPNGHCWFLNGVCADEAALVAAVDERKRRGCDVVKIMVTGGNLTPTFPMWQSQFGEDEVRAVVDAAHAAGLPVAAHCHGNAGIIAAAHAGVDTIEHCSFFSEENRSAATAETLDAVRGSDVVVSATMGTITGTPIPPLIAANLDAMLDSVRTLHADGVRIVAGTDAGVGPAKPHDVLPHATAHFARAGFTPLEMMTAMTAEAADVCRVADRKGRLRAGFDADVLAVHGDPSTDPSALADVAAVWCRGRRVR